MGTPDIVDSLSFEIERLRARTVVSRSPETFSELGRLLRQRFELTGSQTDLDAAVQAFEFALEATSSIQTDAAPYLSNLAAALNDRFVRGKSTEDLDRAIEFASRAVESAEVRGADYPEYLANLGAVLYMRYEISGEPDDLNQAIEASEKALRLVGDENPAAYQINLSTALQARFFRTGDPATLDRAIRFADLSVKATSESDPARWSRIMTLGVCLSVRALQANSSESAAQALSLLGLAANAPSISDSERLQVADVAALVATSQSQWLNATEALSDALDSTEGVSFEKVDSDVAAHRARLASDAATCAIRLGDTEKAIRFFDAGRGRFLTGESMFRRDLSTLAKTAPHLVGSLVELHDYLSVAVSQGARSPSWGARSDRARIRERWAEEVARVRQLPGFTDFLAEPEYSFAEMDSDEIVSAINVSRFGSYAFLIGPGGVTTTTLPGLTLESATKQAELYAKAILVGSASHDTRNRELLLIDILAWLWEVIGGPISELLAGSVGKSRHGVPHINLCVSGPLGILPVHAAGIYGLSQGKVGESLLDLGDFSYVPNISVAIKRTREPRADSGDPAARALIVAPESLEASLAHLPMELRALRNILVHPDALVGQAARRDSIVQEMSGYPIVHFAGHGHWDADDPRSSGILLRDGVLSVEDMLRGSLEKTRLAILSASSTAARSVEDPDEFLSLASAFLVAGCPNVVGTLFSIRDSDASEFAAYFYESLTRDGSSITREQVSRATHVAVKYLRKKYPETPSAWAGFVHLTS